MVYSISHFISNDSIEYLLAEVENFPYLYGHISFKS